MATTCFFPSAGAAPVSPTPSGTDWTLHLSGNSRLLEFANSESAITSLAYNPDAADHLVDGTSHICQFVSQLLPPQVVAAQQVHVSFRALEVAASNNLFPCFKVYGCDAAGTTNLGNIVPFRRSAVLELATSLTGVAEAMAGSAVTFTEQWRLVVELGVGGLPVNTATDTHNATIEFGSTMATGARGLGQNGDTTACPALIIFENDILTSVPIIVPAGAQQPQSFNAPMHGWRR